MSTISPFLLVLSRIKIEDGLSNFHTSTLARDSLHRSYVRHTLFHLAKEYYIKDNYGKSLQNLQGRMNLKLSRPCNEKGQYSLSRHTQQESLFREKSSGMDLPHTAQNNNQLFLTDTDHILSKNSKSSFFPLLISAPVEGFEPPFAAPITINGLEDHLGYTGKNYFKKALIISTASSKLFKS